VLIGVDRDIHVPALARDRDLGEVAREGLERVAHLWALQGTAVPRDHQLRFQCRQLLDRLLRRALNKSTQEGK
jgi:hypothetical protein